MKKILFVSAGILLASTTLANAQVYVGIGGPPVYAPPVYAAPAPIYPYPVYEGYGPWGVYHGPYVYDRHHYYNWGYWHGGAHGGEGHGGPHGEYRR